MCGIWGIWGIWMRSMRGWSLSGDVDGSGGLDEIVSPVFSPPSFEPCLLLPSVFCSEAEVYHLNGVCPEHLLLVLPAFLAHEDNEMGIASRKIGDVSCSAFLGRDGATTL
jgi:hypothetical protein